MRRNESRPTDTILLFYGLCLMENHGIGWPCSKHVGTAVAIKFLPPYFFRICHKVNNGNPSIFLKFCSFQDARKLPPTLGARRITQALNGAWPWIPSVSSLVRAPPPQLLYRTVTRYPHVSAEIVPCSIWPVATFVDRLIMSGWLVTL